MDQAEFTKRFNVFDRPKLTDGDWIRIREDSAIEKIGIDQEECAELLQALGKPNRYQILQTVMGFTYDDLAKAVGIKLERERLRLEKLKGMNK